MQSVCNSVHFYFTGKENLSGASFLFSSFPRQFTQCCPFAKHTPNTHLSLFMSIPSDLESKFIMEENTYFENFTKLMRDMKHFSTETRPVPLTGRRNGLYLNYFKIKKNFSLEIEISNGLPIIVHHVLFLGRPTHCCLNSPISHGGETQSGVYFFSIFHLHKS